MDETKVFGDTCVYPGNRPTMVKITNCVIPRDTVVFSSAVTGEQIKVQMVSADSISYQLFNQEKLSPA